MRTSIPGRFALVAITLSSLATAVAFDSIYADSDVKASSEATPASGSRVDAARFTEAGELARPDDLDRWVFLGASLGMTYEEVKRDPTSPGMFQVVLMEPRAYEYFKAYGKYADGSMFLLSLYGTEQRVSIAESGFVQGDLAKIEIHVLDRARFAEGRAFYSFKKGDQKATAVPPGNACVECHIKNGAFDGTFVQFYPAIRHKIPPELLQKSLRKSTQQ